MRWTEGGRSEVGGRERADLGGEQRGGRGQREGGRSEVGGRGAEGRREGLGGWREETEGGRKKGK